MLEFAAAAPPGRGRARAARAPRRARARPPQPARAREPLRGRARRGLPARSASSRRPTARGVDGCAAERAAAGARRPRAVRAARGHAERGGAAMSAGEILLWIILPYVAITMFVVGHWWRYRPTSSPGPAARPSCSTGGCSAGRSPLFHYGALAAVGGHVIGLLHPAVADRARSGSTSSTYRWIAGDRRRARRRRHADRLRRPRLPPRDQRPRAAHDHPDGHAHLRAAHRR